MQTPVVESASRVEKTLALAGLGICLFITIFIWGGIASVQELWPLPGAYFAELVLLSAVNANWWVRSNQWRWTFNLIVAGVFTAFMILGAFSVGLFYALNVLIFIVLGILAALRGRQNPWTSLATYLIAAAVQALLMLLAARSA
jgi:uncharacterized membrane protein